MAWPCMDCHTKEELVIDQFLMEMNNHKLSVHVVAHGHRRIEDTLHIAQSLEAVHEEEKQTLCACKPTTKAQFNNNEYSVTQGYYCKGYENFARDCPSDGFYWIRPDDLPVRTRDPSSDSSNDSWQAKDKASTTKYLN